MDFSISSQLKPGYLLIESEGRALSKHALFEHARLIFEEIAKYDCRKILLHEPGLELPASVIDYIELVETLSITYPPEIRSFRIAFVLSPRYTDIAHFCETICVNRGFWYYGFTSLQQGEDWLLG